MKRFVIFPILFLIVFSVFSQTHTFQGLPWGSTREQVIAKMGEPDARGSDYFLYYVSVSGYTTRLHIEFNNRGMSYASYEFGFSSGLRRLNESELSAAYIIVLAQLVNTYGNHNEIILLDQRNREGGSFTVWHFNNYHIFISPIENNGFFVAYTSDTQWDSFENDLVSEYRYLLRLPNTGL